MSKQTFTVGQVLTAANLTSLQQTAMLGGAAQAKTASYTLVAADAGTAISMTSTSATTITVNTGLFAAGDTVFIQNLGTANLTITAGTATVNTAGSLILPQYDAGILYFVSASSAVFYDYIQVGAVSPLTTKGDLYTFGTSDTRLAAGTNNSRLVAASGEVTGLKYVADTQNTVIDAEGDLLVGDAADTIQRLALGSNDQVLTVDTSVDGKIKWATPSGGSSGLNLILTESFSAVSSITRDSLFSTTYDNYLILIEFTATATASFNFYLRSSGSNITSGYDRQTLGSSGATVNAARTTGAGEGTVANSLSTGRNYIVFNIASPFLTQRKGFITEALATASSVTNERYMNVSDSTASCTGIYLFPNTGNITGKVSYYGYGK